MTEKLLVHKNEKRKTLFKRTLKNRFSELLAEIKYFAVKYKKFNKLQYYLVKANQKSKLLRFFKNILNRSSGFKVYIKKLKKKMIGYYLFDYNFRRFKRFGGDVILGRIIDKIIHDFSVDSFIETGTFLGGTSFNMAKKFPQLLIYTCEVHKTHYKIARELLKNYNNANIKNKSSEIFLADLLKTIKINNSLIFLDAHWYKYWPLPIEIKLISHQLEKYILIIHDFEVPNRPEFRSDIFLGSKKGEIHCDISFIKKYFNINNNYSILFPKYSEKDAKTPFLVGYIIIFQNLTELFKTFIKDDFIKKYFFSYEF
ncbi:MAG: hypothetical protein ACTSRZ_19870 [Promethearchaeota archaeon]